MHLRAELDENDSHLQTKSPSSSTRESERLNVLQLRDCGLFILRSSNVINHLHDDVTGLCRKLSSCTHAAAHRDEPHAHP